MTSEDNEVHVAFPSMYSRAVLKDLYMPKHMRITRPACERQKKRLLTAQQATPTL